MKLQHEGIFNATITSQAWEVSQSGKPYCKIGFQSDAGDIQGSFFFDEDAPKYGKETGLQKNSRAFTAAIPGWTPAVMDREQTYIGAKVTIETKQNAAGFLNVKGIYPLGHQGGGQKLDTAGDAMARIRAAAAIAAEGVAPAAEQTDEPGGFAPTPTPRNGFADDSSIPF